MRNVCQENWPHQLRSFSSEIGSSIFNILTLALIIGLAACGGPPQNESVNEEGPARLEVSPDSTTEFGTVLVSLETQISIIIRNTSLVVGASDMSISEGLVAPYTFTGGSYPGTGGDCGTTLDPQGTCTIFVSIIPSVEGPQNRDFNF